MVVLMYIYKLTNKLNGKIYIGQTMRTVEERIKEHSRSKKSAAGAAIRKHGIDNFSVEVVGEAESERELNLLEKDFIALEGSFGEKGYNLCVGGGVTSGYSHTEESKLRMSKAKVILFQGKGNPFYGKSHTEESKRKMSQKRQAMAHLTEGQVLNLRKSAFRRSVRNLTTGEVFASVDLAAKSVGVPSTNISRACRISSRSAGKCKWEYV